MESCTFVDVLPQHTDPKFYIAECPIKDDVFLRNLLAMMKRMIAQDDIIILHFEEKNVAVAYRSHCYVNYQLSRNIVQGIQNMESICHRIAEDDFDILQAHIRRLRRIFRYIVK